MAALLTMSNMRMEVFCTYNWDSSLTLKNDHVHSMQKIKEKNMLIYIPIQLTYSSSNSEI